MGGMADGKDAEAPGGDSPIGARAARGQALPAPGRSDEALAALDEAARLDPGNPDRHEARGRLLYGMGRNDEALAALDEAARLGSPDAPALVLRGRVLLAMSQPGRAVRCLKSAVAAAGPANAEARVCLGVAYARLGRYKRALGSIRRGIRLNPREAQAHVALGMVLLKAGRAGGALAAYGEAVRLDGALAEAHVGGASHCSAWAGTRGPWPRSARQRASIPAARQRTWEGVPR